MSFRFKKKLKEVLSRKTVFEIDPDEIFLDSKNLPEFDKNQFEGRLEKPISKTVILVTACFFLLVGFVYAGKVWSLQVTNGKEYEEKSANNRLRHSLIFAERGVIYDRRGEFLAWNKVNPENEEVSHRSYAPIDGISHVLGHIEYPKKDSGGFYYNTEFKGLAGVEKFYNDVLGGKNGLKIVEVNARGKVVSQSVLQPPEDGQSLTLSIDSRLQSAFYNSISKLSKEIGFTGGAAVFIDVKNGEILSLVSFPEYNSEILSSGSESDSIKRYLEDSRKPFLNRAMDGLYTPGSIVKPFLALGALEQGLIMPEKKILSTGSISIPNQYDPKKKTIFNDWKAHGWVDMRDALAVSSNVYFFEVGGGFEDQKGLGISLIEYYARMFGLGEEIPEVPYLSMKGVVPNPEWKAEKFKGEAWHLGDTYNTAIGQYGFQITPLQAARAVTAIANGGRLITPTVLKGGNDKNPDAFVPLPLRKENFTVVKEGMRQAVTHGTGKGLYIPQVSIAAKTGTAEIGVTKKSVNSWVIGFFPYENPKVAFAVLMEKGPRNNTIGALYVLRQVVLWMQTNTPEYLR